MQFCFQLRAKLATLTYGFNHPILFQTYGSTNPSNHFSHSFSYLDTISLSQASVSEKKMSIHHLLISLRRLLAMLHYDALDYSTHVMGINILYVFST
ncbi:hypothetical protein Sjap_023238 [Stephania japonica]|uniref:Uncharacterized protein n=1 Tax=Stephania japonica TaxID=461633 RepID=A0AAP0HMS3_9MAGN